MLREILGIAATAIAVLVLLSLVSFSPLDEGRLGRDLQVQNWVGAGGVLLANKGLVLAFGMGAYIFPLVLLALAIRAFRKSEWPAKAALAARSGAFVLFSLFVATGLHLAMGKIVIDGEPVPSGGVLGILVGGALVSALNLPGAWAITSVGLIISFMVMTRIRVSEVIAAFRATMKALRERIAKARQARQTEVAREKREAEVAEIRKTLKESHTDGDVQIAAPAEDQVAVNAKIRQPKRPKEKPANEKAAKPTREEKKRQEAFEFAREIKTDGDVAAVLPPVDLLEPEEEETTGKVDEEQLKANARILEKKLLDFGVRGQVVAIEPGPVITMYEFRPAPGVKVSKIASLEDDLAMALSAISIRVIAPIPGKDVVGIEIPNKDRQIIRLRDMLENNEFQKAKSRTMLALGKDTTGTPYYWDLQKMPHLLIGGATGQGKSVGINAILLSILYKALPHQVKLILVDPKMLELSVYDGIPHLYAHVVTDPKKAASALKWAVAEMERRYKLLSDYGVRNLEGYNKTVRKELSDGSWKEKARKKAEKERLEKLGGDYGADEAVAAAQPDLPLEPPEELPVLVIVIDELADLMMTVGKEVEDSIARLAQMARAAGIHMILATQTPRKDVITGLIKANFPARLSFKVFSRVDSQVILDATGAEQLLGQGDMLFYPPGSSRIVRVHGAFVTDEEVQAVTSFLKENAGEAHYRDDILDVPLDSDSGAGDDFENESADPLYEQALRVVVESGKASTSYVQRRLSVGYNRAARMIERMERDGLVGPSDGVKPRDVLIEMHQLEDWINRQAAVGG